MNLTHLKYLEKTLKLIFLKNIMGEMSNPMVSNESVNTMTKTHSDRALTQLYKFFTCSKDLIVWKLTVLIININASLF